MIGLGVGIDYALLIVTRFRENLHRGHDRHDAAVIALDTAGRSVLFAGTTVVISLLGMVIMGIVFVTGLAVSAATVVALTMVASLTLLPALLGFAGTRLDVTRRRGLIAAGFLALGLVGAGLGAPPLFVLGVVAAVVVMLASLVAPPLRQRVLEREPEPLAETAAYRWSRVIQHHPWRSAIAGLAFLGVLALPVFGMRLAFADEGNLQEDIDARQAYDLLAEGFGPGFNGPLLVATELPDGADPATLEGVSAALDDDPGVAFVDEVVGRHEAQARQRDVALRASIAPGLPKAWVDPARVRQVLDNLLANAIRHTPAGGEVLVEVSTLIGPSSGDGPMVRCRVTDAGPGFREDQLGQVFERFKRSGDSRGSGLGLSIARDLVRAHGGTIGASNDPTTGGASVSFTLPT
jgi:MMPL family/Histidine kinase-, DNA gyrase B-, and HSP90-like ATPase